MFVFTDVSMASNRNLIQRPCHESDAVFDCRLCDKIVPSNLSGEFMETMKLWMQAYRKIPYCFCQLSADLKRPCLHDRDSLSGIST